MVISEHAADLKPDEHLISDEPAYVRSQYRKQDNLAVRIRTHELYSAENVDFASWILDSIPWRGEEIVLDAGCGAGAYIDAARQRVPGYIAGDLSLGMLQGLAERSVPRINLDVQGLPLRQKTVDVILANHMLYHVPDIPRALREFRRVLRASGRLLAATNSEHNMGELAALSREVLAQLELPTKHAFAPRLTFTLENGAQFLREQFKHVERRDLVGALVFPEPQPVIEYLGSMYERYEPYLPDHIGWQDIVERLDSILQGKIERDGAFRVNKLSGVFVCWND